MFVIHARGENFHFRVKQIRWFAHDFSGNLVY